MNISSRLHVQTGENVLIADGLGKFELELRSAVELEWLVLRVAVLPLQSIIKSKRAPARPKNIAHLPLLEQTLRSLRG